MADQEKNSVAQHTEQSFVEEHKLQSDDISDGDLALQVLHTHFEPYSDDEEKRVLRKIDFRLAALMLLVNGIQFVDKLVSSPMSSGIYLLIIMTDNFSSCHVRSHQGSTPQRPGILSPYQHFLHWLPRSTIPNQHPHATIPDRQIHHR